MQTPNIPSANAHFITLKKAIEMTTAYRKQQAANITAQSAGLPLSETFNRNALDQLLAKPGCAAIRIYYGLDEAAKIHAILVPVNAQNEDILPAEATESSTGTDIVETAQRCPDMCGAISPLNS